MKNLRNVLALGMVFWLVLAGSARAELPESLQKQLHSDKELKITVFTGKNVEQIADLAKNPGNTKIAVVQVLPEDLTDARVQVLMSWVRSGGTLWFYDSRLAGKFGMKAASVSKQGLRCKELYGEYGAIKKYPGIAVAAMAASTSHPVLTGVNAVFVFLLKVGEDEYSAVKEGDGTEPLLRVTPGANVSVAAIKAEGKGKIVFKPLLFKSHLDGERFQANLKEFSAGYRVPAITSRFSRLTDDDVRMNPKSPPMLEGDLLTTSDGRKVGGRVLNQFLIFEGNQGQRKVFPAKTQYIELNSSGGADLLVDQNGTKTSGYFFLKDGLYFLTPSGRTVILKREDIKRIDFGTLGRGRSVLGPAEEPKEQ